MTDLYRTGLTDKTKKTYNNERNRGVRYEI